MKTYAVVDAFGYILRQGYADNISTVQVAAGEYVHESNKILDKNRMVFVNPGSPSGYWAQKTPATDIFGEEVETDNSSTISLTGLTTGTIIKTNGTQFTESGGSVNVTFAGEGYQYVRVEEPDRTPFSRQTKVTHLDTLKSLMKGEVDAYRDIQLTLSLTVGGVTLDGGLEAQRNIAEAATLGALEVISGNVSWSINWITEDNSVISLTAAQLKSFAEAIATRRETQYALARNAKDAIVAASNRAAAEAARDAYIGS